jgi:hypothetical protein
MHYVSLVTGTTFGYALEVLVFLGAYSLAIKRFPKTSRAFLAGLQAMMDEVPWVRRFFHSCSRFRVDMETVEAARQYWADLYQYKSPRWFQWARLITLSVALGVLFAYTMAAFLGITWSGLPMGIALIVLVLAAVSVAAHRDPSLRDLPRVRALTVLTALGSEDQVRSFVEVMEEAYGDELWLPDLFHPADKANYGKTMLMLSVVSLPFLATIIFGHFYFAALNGPVQSANIHYWALCASVSRAILFLFLVFNAMVVWIRAFLPMATFPEPYGPCLPLSMMVLYRDAVREYPQYANCVVVEQYQQRIHRAVKPHDDKPEDAWFDERIVCRRDKMPPDRIRLIPRNATQGIQQGVGIGAKLRRKRQTMRTPRR